MNNIKKAILDYFEFLKDITIEDDLFKEEIRIFSDFTCQITITDLIFTIWVKIRNGFINYGHGTIQNPDITLIAPLKIFSDILKGDVKMNTHYKKGNLKIEGNFDIANDFESIILYSIVYYPDESMDLIEAIPNTLEIVKEGLLIFISYAIKDSDLFKIKEMAENLTIKDDIANVMYCEEDARENFIKYMNEYIGKCDIMILCCSPNALNSKFVEKEWMAAEAMNKPIIPIFFNVEHIPALLRARIGVEYNPLELNKKIDAIYTRILKIMEEKKS